MDFAFTPDEEAFRLDVRQWLNEHLTEEFRSLHRTGVEGPEAWATRVAWEQELARGGWVAMSWPREYGGRGATLHEQLIFDTEYARSAAPSRASFFGEQLLGPTMIVHGTEPQKRRFLPSIVRGEQYWCQGYSEPDAGSDLANVATRARLDGDQWVIDGQKVWTSFGQYSDWIFVLCRTDPTAPRHKGLSLLLCELDQPGIEIRPIRQITGGSEFNEIYFNRAVTDADLVLGPVNEGWRVAMSVLGFERGTAFLAQQRGFARELDNVVATARANEQISHGPTRDRLSRAYGELEVMRFLGLRTISALGAGHAPGPESSVTKLFWSHWHQRLGDLAMEVAGASAMVLADGHLDEKQYQLLFSRQDTIAAGSSEIQHNILGERVLGLPAEPRPEPRPV
jgi:alkylation response protein AidB-like acyl-CoA dehydrogenase